MEFFGKSFTETIETLIGEPGKGKPVQPSPLQLSTFHLPPHSRTTQQVKRYAEKYYDAGNIARFSILLDSSRTPMLLLPAPGTSFDFFAQDTTVQAFFILVYSHITSIIILHFRGEYENETKFYILVVFNFAILDITMLFEL